MALMPSVTHRGSGTDAKAVLGMLGDAGGVGRVLEMLRATGAGGDAGDGASGPLVFATLLPARPAEYAMLDPPLPPPLQRHLDRAGIRLYRHQVDAIQAVRGGGSVVVSTPTASGKTLAFNLPVFERLATPTSSTATSCAPPPRSPSATATRHASARSFLTRSPTGNRRGGWPRRQPAGCTTAKDGPLLRCRWMRSTPAGLRCAATTPTATPATPAAAGCLRCCLSGAPTPAPTPARSCTTRATAIGSSGSTSPAA